MMMEHSREKQQLVQSGQKETASKRRVLLLVCLAVAMVMALCAVVGVVCWRISEDQAMAQLAEIQRQNEERYEGFRSSAHRRVMEAWNRTLEDLYPDVVFYGDSLMAGGVWGEWYPEWTCINLGVEGDTVANLHSRIVQVEMLEPSKCFLMIGINDLNYGFTVEKTLKEYQAMLSELAALGESTDMQIYVFSVLPVREGEIGYPATNSQIRLLNEGIVALTDRLGLTYIDMHTLFADEDGLLKKKYSYDGIHLSDAGYQKWQEVIGALEEE